ncbi:hypothetical protein SARC_06774 [Sphaeroforma arctica JP610]|uniref:Uncharacterized protein n=1 Tax=Sphaeroforma arctica JP610 TaxID=667725 RepID=A0A0L0FVJ4_9EUKA|nr:hypothetical protein SARC_06774 [Sphaeroforma arctica JP610]KNC80875.1 hypothetical protein SARC_06774 [Sphaeroforma arctica JP610]|eukprot:XP_014154777.1 hypothetical protein SARC_06774 [Sphaeroforma arctica JP610]
MYPDKPPKRIVGPGGRMVVNPEWKRWRENIETQEVEKYGYEFVPAGAIYANGTDTNNTLIPVTNHEDHAEMVNSGCPYPLVEEVGDLYNEMREPDYALEIGGDPQAGLNDLISANFAKYELSLATLSKVMRLTVYDQLEFIIDDSGSMGAWSDTIDPVTTQKHTRWTEAKHRIKQKLDILSLFACPPIHFRFMNNTRNNFNVTRAGKSPEQFKREAFSLVEGAFRARPNGGTPAFTTLQKSFDEGRGKKVFRYVYFDGVPNERVRNAEEKIRDLLLDPRDRGNPEDSPVNFLSCTDEDDCVEWVKQLEEADMYCGGPSYLAEIDDFDTEANEVFGDQGKVFPYNKGMYLVCSLVAAAFPDTLDALDECIPIPRFTLERDFVGFELQDSDYKRYWDGFIEGQQVKRTSRAYRSDRIEKFKADFTWHYSDFAQCKGESIDIPAVKVYKEGLTNLIKTPGDNDQSAQSNTGGSFLSWFGY